MHIIYYDFIPKSGICSSNYFHVHIFLEGILGENVWKLNKT